MLFEMGLVSCKGLVAEDSIFFKVGLRMVDAHGGD